MDYVERIRQIGSDGLRAATRSTAVKTQLDPDYGSVPRVHADVEVVGLAVLH